MLSKQTKQQSLQQVECPIWVEAWSRPFFSCLIRHFHGTAIVVAVAAGSLQHYSEQRHHKHDLAGRVTELKMTLPSHHIPEFRCMSYLSFALSISSHLVFCWLMCLTIMLMCKLMSWSSPYPGVSCTRNTHTTCMTNGNMIQATVECMLGVAKMTCQRPNMPRTDMCEDHAAYTITCCNGKIAQPDMFSTTDGVASCEVLPRSQH